MRRSSHHLLLLAAPDGACARLRLRAEGNARLSEANGKVTVGQIIDLTDDYRHGFVDALAGETVAPRGAAHQPQRWRLLPRQ